MKKLLFVPLLIMTVSVGVFGQALYSSTTYASRYNPGVGSQGTPIVAYDDVNIPTAIAGGGDSISITKIRVGIRRIPNAPATKVNLYYAPFQQDSSNRNFVQPTPVVLGTVSLPKNEGALVTTIISFGDSVLALFKVKAESGKSNKSIQKFLIGASFDNPSPANGIVLTKELSNNQDSIWINNTDNESRLYATSFNGQLPASYHLEVYGTAPERLHKAPGSSYSDVASGRNYKINEAR